MSFNAKINLNPQGIKKAVEDKIKNKSFLDKKFLFAVTATLLVIIYLLYNYFTSWESTDDAFVNSHIHAVSSRVEGTVSEILTTDNQLVKEGQVLAKLDIKDFEARLLQAKGPKHNAEMEFKRVEKLLKTNSVSQQEFDAAQAEYEKTMGAFIQAELNLHYTTILAPADGIVGRKNLEVGNRVYVGQPLVAVVEQKPWIVANYKETQIAKIMPGQAVIIYIDAFPGKTFKGKVDSISPATGSQFALLPPDNATGNYTKVVQRVPVKIIFDSESIKGYEAKIVAGLSVIPHIKVK